MRITYIGHATLLLEIGGARFLTDPNYDASLGGFLPRVSAPGIALEALPELDAILLTHAHADHLSFATLARLPRTIPIIAPGVIVGMLARRGISNVRALDAGSSVVLGRNGIRVHAARAVHRGNRFGFDRWRSDANMYLLEDDAESVFFAGDTALTESTHEFAHGILAPRHRQLDVALLPIGYAPPWKPGFRRGHLTGDDALTLFERLEARAMIPYHWGTFRHVTATAFDAINRLRARLEAYAGRDHVHILEPGEVLVVDAQRLWTE